MTDSESRSSYRNIMKGTAVFGGVQVFNILVNILRGKLIALFLGPAGMGISALFTSSTNTIIQFSSFGLNLSAVKNISQAFEKGDIGRVSSVIKIFRRLVIISGIIGGLVAILGAPWLSDLTFGNKEYSLAFVLLAIMLFFTILANGENALLQGVRHLKSLAKSSMIGALVGLFVGIPLYYFFGTDGIVPAMVCLALAMYFTKRYFTSKIVLDSVAVTYKETITEGKQMVSLGIVLMCASLIGTITAYLINIYVSNYGSVLDVGFFQAASSLTSQYVGLVFSAMAVDYFPRLAAIADDNVKVRESVNYQAEIVILIVTPLVITLILTAPFVVRILLTKEFLVIVPLLRWMALGLFFKALAFPLGYISFSKGDKKMFFWLEGIIGNAIVLFLNVIGYFWWGLIGLGISFAFANMLYFFIIVGVTRIRYGFKYNDCFIKLLIPLLIFCFVSFGMFELLDGIMLYIVLCIILILSYCYSFYQLDKRVDIKKLIAEKLNKLMHK